MIVEIKIYSLHSRCLFKSHLVNHYNKDRYSWNGIVGKLVPCRLIHLELPCSTEWIKGNYVAFHTCIYMFAT